MMLIIPDEVVTDALVNAIAVVGRKVGKAVSGLRKPDETLPTARWFETFRLTETVPELPALSPASGERLAGVLDGPEIQAALQELLAARLTDAPELDASRARDAVEAALCSVGPEVAGVAARLACYYDDQICALVVRLEAEEPPLLAQIRSEAFSSRLLSSMHAIERHTAALADGTRRGDGPARSESGVQPGRLLDEVTDPFALEVHRPLQADGFPTGILPVLPLYVPREHDRQLAGMVRAAAEGASMVAVLVGGSSTGKTRACWEALGPLREQLESWRLWHPIDPSRPKAALRELPLIGPRTVVWLNEAQFYLDPPASGLGERVAAGLRELLRDPGRAPVLVLATLWPQFWNRLTLRPDRGEDPHEQTRELLAGRDITVPPAFTAAQMRQLAAAGDPRLVLAAAAAEDGHAIQFLAGAPELLARYRNASLAAAGLIKAAMDARRLGMGIALPFAFLEAAAPGYMSDTDWDALPEDWLERALADLAAPSKGIRGPLTRIRPRNIVSADSTPGPAYRLADYLDQDGRRTRRSLIPPSDFWTAAESFAPFEDLATLAQPASARGLLRNAAGLRKRAVAYGDTSQAAELIRCLHDLHPGDLDPARWATAYAAVDEPRAVAELLESLRLVGAAEQTAALLARNPAMHASLDDVYGVASLLDALRQAGADEQAMTLAARAAALVSLDGLYGVVSLLVVLRKAGADEQAKTLTERVAAHASPDDLYDLIWLLEAPREARAAGLAKTLAERAVAHVPVDDLYRVAMLVELLLDAGAAESAKTLAERAAAHVSLDDLYRVATLVKVLRQMGADEQARSVAERASAEHATVDDPEVVATLLHVLRGAGANGQSTALLARDPATHALLNLSGTARLLEVLRHMSANAQAKTLAARAASGATLHDPEATARLLNTLVETDADEQAKILSQRGAAQTPLSNPAAVARLLDELRAVGADEEVKILAERAAAHAPLSDPAAVARFLDGLRAGGAEETGRCLAGPRSGRRRRA